MTHASLGFPVQLSEVVNQRLGWSPELYGANETTKELEPRRPVHRARQRIYTRVIRVVRQRAETRASETENRDQSYQS